MEVIVCAGIDRGQEECPRARLECQCLDDPCPSGGDGGVLGLGQPQRRREVDRILTGRGGDLGRGRNGDIQILLPCFGLFRLRGFPAAAVGLAWEGTWVAVEVRATAGSRAEFVASDDWSRVWAAMDGAVRAVLEFRSVAQPEKRRAELAQRRTTNVAIGLRVGSNFASVLACIGCPHCSTLKTVSSASGRTARRSIGGWV